jgi:hypothetical protein
MTRTIDRRPHMVLLRGLPACRPGLRFARQYDSLQAAWEACDRPDWMLWLLRWVNETPRAVLEHALVPMYTAADCSPGRPRCRAACDLIRAAFPTPTTTLKGYPK